MLALELLRLLSESRGSNAIPLVSQCSASVLVDLVGPADHQQWVGRLEVTCYAVSKTHNIMMSLVHHLEAV